MELTSNASGRGTPLQKLFRGFFFFVYIRSSKGSVNTHTSVVCVTSAYLIIGLSYSRLLFLLYETEPVSDETAVSVVALLLALRTLEFLENM